MNKNKANLIALFFYSWYIQTSKGSDYMAKKKKNAYEKVSIFIIILTLIILVSSIYVLIKSRNILRPDYAPGVIDKNAVPLPDNGEKMKASEGGGAVSLSYSNKVSIDLNTRELTLYFQNPKKSTHNIVLEVIVTQNDKETVIAQSDILPVGYAIYKLELNKDIKLLKGGYNGKFNIVYYDEKTEEKAALNTDIPIKIAVE